MRIIAINGRTWSPEVLQDAIATNRTAPGALKIFVQSHPSAFEATVEDHGGLQYPRLERNSFRINFPKFLSHALCIVIRLRVNWGSFSAMAFPNLRVRFRHM